MPHPTRRPKGLPVQTAHLRCGSDIQAALAEAGIAGDFVEYADPVCEGPLPDGAAPADWRAVRAGFIASEWGYDEAEILARLEAEDAALDALGDYAEVFLWFEHDLFDQAILIRVLDRLAPIQERLHLISLGAYPGIERFTGLGQLSPFQLGTLLPTAEPVTDPMIALAGQAWSAYRNADPQALCALLACDTAALPFLAAALRRHLQEFPWTRDGLGLTERLTLQAVAGGAGTPGRAFGDLMQRLDPAPYLGDVMFWAVVKRLAGGAQPALTPFTGVRDPIGLTDFGAALLDGQADWVAANGIDRWRGGVQLSGPKSPWRWDEDAGVLKRS